MRITNRLPIRVVRRGLFAIALVAALASAGAVAGDKPKQPEPGTAVEMPYLIAPVVVDGKLTANAYISSKVIGSSLNASLDIRDKLAFIQDAFVRDVNAVPIGKATDPSTVDEAGLRTRLLADARRIVGAAAVADVKIIRVQISPIRASPAP